MSYKIDKCKLLEKACNIVVNKVNKKPCLVFMDMLKYIDGYFNSSIKIYVVLDTEEDFSFDDNFLYDNSQIQVKAISLEDLLNTNNYKVTALLSNLTNSIAIINNSNTNHVILKLMNIVEPINILEEINNEIKQLLTDLLHEKELTSKNRIIFSRMIKYSFLFINLFETFDILNSYYNTIKILEESKTIFHLLNNIPILERVSFEKSVEVKELNDFARLKEQMEQTANFIDNLMISLY